MICAMSPDTPDIDATPLVEVEIERVVTELGTRIRDERRRRGMTLREVAELAHVAISSVQKVESGSPGSMEMYVRIARALERTLEISLVEPAATSIAPPAPLDVGPVGADIVHAAMGEYEVTVLGGHGYRVSVDEPWQHYRFSGRADVLGWDSPGRALLHIENRTQFPDVQDSAGRYNGKKAYLAGAIWERLGMAGPPLSVTHAVVALWSAEVIEVLRRSPATFAAVCPDPPDAFLGWWAGRPPRTGVTSTLLLLDPFATGAQRRFATLREVLDGAGPRVSGYAAAADLVRAASARTRLARHPRPGFPLIVRGSLVTVEDLA